jgi:hypothetical protein
MRQFSCGLVCFAASLVCITAAPHAFAFCRTTTCDVAGGHCARDANGCSLDGSPLSWAHGCLQVNVESGSLLRGISRDEVAQATQQALLTWTQARCERSEPALAFDVVASEEHDKYGVGAIRFRDQDWPHHDLRTNVALTTLTIDKSNGRILGADVELNSFGQPFFKDGSSSRYDLELVLLHEMGHVLGLGHSSEENSRMRAEYREPVHRQRWLSHDDERGVCAAYPPTRAPSCLAAGGISLCETLEECRWVALVLLSASWGVFGVLWRYRYGVWRRRASALGR